MSAIETHDRMVAAYSEQQARINARRPGEDVWTGALAARFRDNPHRELDPTLASICADLLPGDTLVDAGGGAGRMSLPLALRCHEVLNVDPSEGMRQEFESVRTEAGIENARFIQRDWLESAALEGDVALAGHVTYFVPDIRTFVGKLNAAARRRAFINVLSVPPPNSGADLFKLQHGEEQALVPGHAQLLPVLWEMGFLPEVRVLPPMRLGGGGRNTGVFPTKEEAIASLIASPLLGPADPEKLQSLGNAHFDTLFVQRDGAWVRTPGADARPLLITWETHPG
jgi:hypothetical protein